MDIKFIKNFKKFAVLKLFVNNLNNDIMNIGIIGSGYIGGTLTRRLAALGHKVFVSNATVQSH